jgi:hypothetical protein
METLLKIQSELKAPKDQINKFGNYNYRSCEDILEAVKPLLLKHKSFLWLTDKIVCLGNRYYVEATAHFSDGTNKIEVSSLARESEEKKGMDASQITGAASSYARKYALNGLFLIDDNKDVDSTQKEPEPNNSTDIINAISKINGCKTLDELQKVWSENKTLQVSEAFVKAKENKKTELNKAANV